MGMSLVNVNKPQFSFDFYTFSKEILKGKLIFAIYIVLLYKLYISQWIDRVESTQQRHKNNLSWHLLVQKHQKNVYNLFKNDTKRNHSGVFIVNFQQISHIFLALTLKSRVFTGFHKFFFVDFEVHRLSLLFTLNRYLFIGMALLLI